MDNNNNDTNSGVIERNIKRHSGRYLLEDEYNMYNGIIPILNIEGRIIDVSTKDGIKGQYYCTKDIEDFIGVSSIAKLMYDCNIPISERLYVKISKYTYVFISIGAMSMLVYNFALGPNSDNHVLRKTINDINQNIIRLINKNPDAMTIDNIIEPTRFKKIEKEKSTSK